MKTFFICALIFIVFLDNVKEVQLENKVVRQQEVIDSLSIENRLQQELIKSIQ